MITENQFKRAIEAMQNANKEIVELDDHGMDIRNWQVAKSCEELFNIFLDTNFKASAVNTIMLWVFDGVRQFENDELKPVTINTVDELWQVVFNS